MRVLIIVAAFIATGCSSSVTPFPASSSPAIASAVASAVEVSPTTVATPSPVAASPTASPTLTPAPTKATPRPTPTPTLSKTEQLLVAQVRADSRVACVPRRIGLPARAIAGVECHLDGALVSLVGAYRFRSEEDAVKTYLDRLAQFGVRPRTGDCRAGTAGDKAWPDYLPDRSDSGGLSPYRSGCFRNAAGLANVRLTCYNGVYMGVVGRTADLSALYKWAWRIAAGESTHRDPPGLCASPD
jgi:hypothetical protein